MAKRKGKAPSKDLPARPQNAAKVNPFDLAAPLSSKVQIDGVILADCRSCRAISDHELDTHGGFMLSIDANTSDHKVDIINNTFEIKASFVIIARSDDSPDNPPAFQIEASFVLRYLVESVGDYKDEVFDAFAKTNGVYNAWPYWREFVHNTTARMGLPSVVIPVFRFQ